MCHLPSDARVADLVLAVGGARYRFGTPSTRTRFGVGLLSDMELILLCPARGVRTAGAFPLLSELSDLERWLVKIWGHASGAPLIHRSNSVPVELKSAVGLVSQSAPRRLTSPRMASGEPPDVVRPSFERS